MARSNSISYLLISTHPTLPQNIPNTQGQILTLILYQILQERNRSSCSTPLNLKRAVVKTTPKTTILTLKRLPLSPPRFLIFLEAVCSQCIRGIHSHRPILRSCCGSGHENSARIGPCLRGRGRFDFKRLVCRRVACPFRC